MKIGEVYEKYKIPPWLAEHMYRVAAVAATLFDASGLTEGRSALLVACLLHDMGNIIKFDFENPALPIPSGERAHWEAVQKDMFARYGHDEHAATLAMLDEIGVSPRVREIIDAINFRNAEAIERSGDILVQIAQYADSRVVPSGIASLAARMQDMYARYANKHPKDDDTTHRRVQALERLEQSLFAGLTIRPEDITEESTAALRVTLSHFEI